MKSGLLGMFQTNNRLGREGCEKSKQCQRNKTKVALSLHSHKENYKKYYSFQVQAIRCFKLHKIKIEVYKLNKMLTSSHFPIGEFLKPSVMS